MKNTRLRLSPNKISYTQRGMLKKSNAFFAIDTKTAFHDLV
ncbi:MAG: hypothetical protein PUG26_06800 [Oscillospiraceae bacterium]|nr:hypothetical protein [Oscillospiraceae bacterium]